MAVSPKRFGRQDIKVTAFRADVGTNGFDVNCALRRQHEGWTCPSPRSKLGHITIIVKGFQSLRDRAGLSKRLVLYSARPIYGGCALAATGNLFAVTGSMGHVDLKSMEPYQHHDLASLRAAINLRNQNPSPSVPKFGHIGQNGSDGISVENFNSFNKQDLVVGPEGFEPPTKGL